tara:strand:- start:4733 stop:4912 length:180 start_codon:yes stop_codon:yes gene_type:complete
MLEEATIRDTQGLVFGVFFSVEESLDGLSDSSDSKDSINIHNMKNLKGFTCRTFSYKLL